MRINSAESSHEWKTFMYSTLQTLSVAIHLLLRVWIRTGVQSEKAGIFSISLNALFAEAALIAGLFVRSVKLSHVYSMMRATTS